MHTNDYVVAELLKGELSVEILGIRLDPMMKKGLNRIQVDRKPEQQNLLV